MFLVVSFFEIAVDIDPLSVDWNILIPVLLVLVSILVVFGLVPKDEFVLDYLFVGLLWAVEVIPF